MPAACPTRAGGRVMIRRMESTPFQKLFVQELRAWDADTEREISAANNLYLRMHKIAVKRARDEELAARAEIRKILPRPLHWLLDHPRLLRLYFRLPFQSLPVRRIAG